jgi:protein TonB
MNNRYTLPIAAAVALHTSLMFGFRHSAAPTLVREDITVRPRTTIALVRLEETPEPTDLTSVKKGSEVESPIKAPETFTTPVDRTFTFSPPVTRGPSSDRIPLDMGPPGVPNGDVLGTISAPIYPATGLDKTPTARMQAPPVYPSPAKQGGVEGEVTVEFLVDETGSVLNPVIVRSSNRVFDEASLRAVSKWRFEPGRRDGRVVRFRMAVPVVFHLNDR